jgi:hypothetical protein
VRFTVRQIEEGVHESIITQDLKETTFENIGLQCLASCRLQWRLFWMQNWIYAFHEVRGILDWMWVYHFFEEDSIHGFFNFSSWLLVNISLLLLKFLFHSKSNVSRPFNLSHKKMSHSRLNNLWDNGKRTADGNVLVKSKYPLNSYRHKNNALNKDMLCRRSTCIFFLQSENSWESSYVVVAAKRGILYIQGEVITYFTLKGPVFFSSACFEVLFFLLLSAWDCERKGIYKWNYIFLFTEMKITIEMDSNCCVGGHWSQIAWFRTRKANSDRRNTWAQIAAFLLLYTENIRIAYTYS